MPLISITSRKHLYYEEYGQGIPIIFIHPPGMGRKVFYYQRLLSEHFRVIFPDLSGHGDSDHADQPASISYYANEIVQFMDALHIDKAVLFGYSAGGLIAQHIGFTRPDKVSHLVLSGAYPAVHNVIGEKIHKTGMYLLEKNAGLLIKILAVSHTKNKELRHLLTGHMKKADLSHWHQYYQDSLRYNCIEQLPRLHMPMLFMYGGLRDWTFPASGYYRKACSHAEFFRLEYQGHQLPTKQWKTCNELVTGFVLTHHS
ncbi:MULTISPECIES: alpha/beta fold hydrolase [Bacillus]|uniref:Alpha/beta hydrolase n=1 Tax=Bacillus rugosus TaxID=2715209 RepID=A0ACD3ZX14_9BACI|nr:MULTISPECIES: alpha/beta hydrolase [Bacillus]MBY4602371.1 alpha/beta hydrolase [Bacillus sp. SPARC3]UPV78481.1 alpha/beta hydrolase [Bacillus rugosus]